MEISQSLQEKTSVDYVICFMDKRLSISWVKLTRVSAKPQTCKQGMVEKYSIMMNISPFSVFDGNPC